MNRDAPPIILTFGISDPTGASGIQADLMTLASLGCHGVTVLTGYATRDTRDAGEITAIEPEKVAAQARMLLEDMPVAAFKVGATMRAEIVAAIAEVVADYDDIPLITLPDFTLDDEHVLAGDDLRDAIAELLTPQTSIMLAPEETLVQLLQADHEGEVWHRERIVGEIIDSGCEYLLLTEHSAGQHINTLYGEGGEIQQDVFVREPHALLGSSDTLAAAIAALLARGFTPPDAIREAQQYLYQAIRCAYRPGMGAFMPNRMFWAKRPTDEPCASVNAVVADHAHATTAAQQIRH